MISKFKLKPAGILSNKFSYKTSLAKLEMHISDVSSFMPTPDPAIIFNGIVWTVLIGHLQDSLNEIVWLLFLVATLL